MSENPALDFLQARSLFLDLADEVVLVQVGAGGTGSWLAPHVGRIARMLAEKFNKRVTYRIVDGDRVAPKNVYRQNFCQAEIGQNKAAALAYRLTAAWGIPVDSVPSMFEGEQYLSHEYVGKTLVFIGCVDNAEARREIDKACDATRAYGHLRWWLDCGNTKDAGQILLGRSALTKGEDPFLMEGHCTWLPLPALQAPDLLEDQPVTAEPENEANLSCADLALRGAQGLAVNARMAAEAADFLWRMLVTRDLKRYQAFLQLASGVVASSYILPETILPFGSLSTEIEPEDFAEEELLEEDEDEDWEDYDEDELDE